ncbi:MAG: family 65 glycosyl hydrolase [Actinomycetota bacterium]|nr:family 65 glycosyl hydrolase [Actinomycetota bacterium]
MINHPCFAVDAWSLPETSLDLEVLGHAESLFAVSNGHIGLRGNLDEGDPHSSPGTYLNGFYELRPLPYPEGGYGYPESGQTVVNVTNGKVIRLLVDDEPFDVRYGTVLGHERVLDFRDGVLRRRAEWRSPAGAEVRVSSTRMVSFVQRAIAAVRYQIEPLNRRVDVVVQSELVANEPGPTRTDDPRSAAALASPLHSEQFGHRDQRVVLLHATNKSGLVMGAGMDHLIEGGNGTEVRTESEADLGRVMVTASLEPGQKLTIVKFLAYGWSGERSVPAIRDQVEGALAGAWRRGWDGLAADQRGYLDDFWARSDVEIDGDPEMQQALRFAMFHVLQAAARAERRSLPAKGLTGPGYDGHSFWDTETFVLQLLTYAAPDAARDALTWRHSMLPQALKRAQLLGLAGAAFPWRTIHGEECSGYWPAGTAAMHVNADIAHAVVRYQGAAEDNTFEREIGLPLLVQTARLWASVGHYDDQGDFRIAGVTGPDEYSALSDDNVYTNLMAQANLRAAAAAIKRYPDEGVTLEVSSDETDAWRTAADAVVVPYDEHLGVHSQARGFTQHERWDFSNTRPDQFPLLLNFPYFDLYRKQVVKQADLVLALHLCGDCFSKEEKARAFDYYEPLTVRDSSLSACTQAVIAAEVGHLDLAYDYLAEAALMDLSDLEHNVADGLHMASLAGAWIAVVAGLGGMRQYGGKLAFAPRLPEQLTRLCFRLTFRGRLLRVEVTREGAAYRVMAGEALEISHFGTATRVGRRTKKRSIPSLPALARPTQPPGREPARRPPTSSATSGLSAGSLPVR